MLFIFSLYYIRTFLQKLLIKIALHNIYLKAMKIQVLTGNVLDLYVSQMLLVI